MEVLHNRISNEELKEQLMQETESRTTISFYQYFPIQYPREFRDYLYKNLFEIKIFGRIYVAHEGINAQISVPEKSLKNFRDFLYSIEALQNTRLNIAVEDSTRLSASAISGLGGRAGRDGNDPAGQGKSFWALRIKVRNKIVADGIDDPAFSMENKGRYVNAKEINEMMQHENTIVLDMRNHYEYEVGHFTNAIEIPSDTFREQLPMAVDMMQDNKEKNIIMYCTGGIRCEKASAYMLHQGFKNVFHLEGGIINYVRQTSELGIENKFTGKNFVFDNRLGERVSEDIIAKCHQCGKPCDDHTNCKNNGCHLLFIQCTQCAEKFEGCCSIECFETINLPAERQKQIRSGIDKGSNIFNKSKQRLRPKLNENKGFK